MADPMDIRTGLSSATGTLEAFAAEMQRMSKDSLENANTLMDKLRGARSMEDIVAIQTSFMHQSFASYADYTRRFSELMMTMPMELAKQGQAAFQRGTAVAMQTATHAAEQAGEEVRKATDGHGSTEGHSSTEGHGG